jgi:hypothetical protein
MTDWVIGFDLSLTAPAAIALPTNWKPGDWKIVKAWLGKPTAPKQDDMRGRLVRYEAIAEWAVKIVGVCSSLGVRPACFVEAYGFSKNNAQASQIMGSGEIVKLEVFRRWGALITPVAANTARKLFMGKCPQKDPKTHVQNALFNKCKAPKTWDENQADAFVIANWGLSEAGGKCLSLA